MKAKSSHYRARFITITLLIIAGLTAVGFVLWYYLKDQSIPLLQPKGDVGAHELNLLIFTGILSLVVIIPVFSIALFIAFRYHEGNEKAKYSPNWDSNRVIESIWWGIPVLLIAIIGTATWISTHKLDPYRPLDADKPILKIQVVALDWKWLFIYPDQHIATVNFVEFPTDTQINFEITADAPMNSFWIPQLGGQIYAMPGMTTHQFLNATAAGDYRGSSANISGPGFADMKFTARAVSKDEFIDWIQKTKDKDLPILTKSTYNHLAMQSKNEPVKTYGNVNFDVFETVLKKYSSHNMSDHSHTERTDTTTEHNHSSMPSMSMENH